jgi:transcription-repair coupling factor (superfamily II helicase)
MRGAGDILSTRQTGHVAAIGLRLYTQLLTQAIQTLKGKTEDEPTPAVATAGIIIDLPIPAYLPGDWIPEIALRLQIYRRIAVLTTRESVEAMRDELHDRFGQTPKAVDGLLYQIEVKLLAQGANASAVLSRDGKIEIRLPYLVEVNRSQLAMQLGADVRVTRTAIEIQPTDSQWRERLLEVLTNLSLNIHVATGV